MGNEQSALSARKPSNKLSKPRTNNNSNLNLLNAKSGPSTRRASVSTTNDSSILQNIEGRFVNEHSGGDDGVATGKRDRPIQKKRLSLFRSRSEKTRSKTIQLDPPIENIFVESGPFNPIPNRYSRPLPPTERGNSFLTETSADDIFFEPTVDPYALLPFTCEDCLLIFCDRHILRSRLSFHQAQAAQYAQQLNRLSLVAELPTPVQPPRPKQPSIRACSIRTSIYEQEETGTQASRAGSRRNSDAEKYGPIRRRSLLQHGIATRPTPFVENDPRRSLPSQLHTPEVVQSHYSRSLVTLPPPELKILGPDPAFAIPGPRTETPTDLEYRHIGAFKLGSLRITNGAASPSPSRDGRSNSLGAEEDFSIIGQTSKIIEKEHRRGLSHRSNTLSVPAETRKAQWVVRGESPLRQGQDTEYEPLKIDIPDPSFALFDFKSTETMFKSTHSPTKSLELAHEYQQEIASSPFSFENSPLLSPGLQSTSKHTAIEDELFAPEPNTPHLEGNLRMPRSFDSGYDGGPVHKPKGPGEKNPRPLAKADSGYSSIISMRSFKKESSPAIPPKDSPPTPIHETFARVTSSTYSVNSSFGSETTVPSDQPQALLPREQCADMPPEPEREPPAVPPKGAPYQPLPSPPVPPKPTSQIKNVIQSQPPLQASKKTSRRKSLSAAGDTGREVEDSSAAFERSALTTSSSSIWQRKKLNKRASRPSSFQPQHEPVFTVQVFHSPSEVHGIPVPPSDIRQHLEERVEAFPTTAFPNTVSGTTQLRRTASKETLGTIFSVGSAEIRAELNFARLQGALPAIPKEATIQEDPNSPGEWVSRPDFTKRHTLQASSLVPAPEPDCTAKQSSRRLIPHEPHHAPMLEHRKSFSKVPVLDPSPTPVQHWPSRRSFRKPGSRDPSPAAVISRTPLHPDFEAQITSFDGVSSSLGRSSYELAQDAIPKQTKSFAYARARSMTAQSESDASQIVTRSRTTNQEGQALRTVRSRRSYDSIPNSNPYSGDNRSQNSVQSRISARGPPPSAHANPRRPYSLQQSYSRESMSSYSGQLNQRNESFILNDESQRFSPLRSQKPKSAPPVSMTTQRGIVPPSRTQLVPQQLPIRTPPEHSTPPKPRQSPLAEAWRKSAGAWAERKRGVGEALSSRTSFEITQPPSSRLPIQQPEPQLQELRARTVMDHHPYGESFSRAGSARSSMEFSKVHVLHVDKSFDTSQQSQAFWSAGTGYENSNLHGLQYYGQTEYSHTYGSVEYSQHNKENFNRYPEQEYYEPQPELDQQRVQFLPEAIHQRKTSTTQMLLLDRFAEGLDYEYKTGSGLVGSAGTKTADMGNAGRKIMRDSMQYGVDFSDVPIILQRVRVEN
jgi:hypothetical protein